MPGQEEKSILRFYLAIRRLWHFPMYSVQQDCSEQHEAGRLPDNVRVDAIANIFSRRYGTDAAPALPSSHLNSQPHPWRFDGCLDVLGALELVYALGEERIETSHPIKIIN